MREFVVRTLVPSPLWALKRSLQTFKHSFNKVINFLNSAFAITGKFNFVTGITQTKLQLLQVICWHGTLDKLMFY